MFVTQGDLVQYFLMGLSESNLANLRQWSQLAKKQKRKKQKTDRKQTEKRNFLALGDFVRNSNKVFIESNSLCFWLASFFAPTAAYMTGWLRDKVMWQRLTKIRYFFKQIFDHKLTEEGKCETEWSIKACEGYKVFEKFDKVCS